MEPFKNRILYTTDDEGGGSPPPEKPGEDPPKKSGGQEKPPATWDEIFEHPRFKELNKRASDAEGRLKQIEEERKKADEERLKKQEEWKELAEKRERELEVERLKRLQFEIGSEKGLPSRLISRLNGSTREELEADADAILSILEDTKGGKGTPPGSSDRSDRKAVELDGKSPSQIRKAMQEAMGKEED